MLHERSVECPCCGARFTALIDTAEGSCEYIQDCEVCCRPLKLVLDTDPFGDEFALRVLREDDA